MRESIKRDVEADRAEVKSMFKSVKEVRWRHRYRKSSVLDTWRGRVAGTLAESQTLGVSARGANTPATAISSSIV